MGVRTEASCGASAPCRHAAGPGDDAIFVVLIAEIFLRDCDTSAHRNASSVHRLGIARYQWMPPVKIAAVRQQPVAAGRRQPFEVRDVLVRQPHAIIDLLAAVLVVFAPAGVAVEQATAHIRVVNPAGVEVLELVEAAAPAAVAYALPLGRGHFRKRLAAPKWCIVHCSTPGLIESTAQR